MSNTINAILGPSYSYPTNIKSMKDMGFDAANNTSQLIENVNGSLEYIKQLATGPALGNNFFLKSGKCSTGTSTVEKCRGKDRYLFVRNIPTGTIPCIGNPGISLDGNEGARGIIPGIMEDAIDINPIEISKAMLGISKKFGPDCVEKTYLTGGIDNNGNGRRAETRCSPDVEPSDCLVGGGKKKTGGLEKFRFILSLLSLITILMLLGCVYVATKKKNIKLVKIDSYL